MSNWLKGKSNRLYTRDGYDYLRLNGDLIETTQGVKIPIVLAKNTYTKLVSNSLSIGDKVLDYTIDEIGDTLKIGCHTFKAEYLVKFGQGVFK